MISNNWQRLARTGWFVLAISTLGVLAWVASQDLSVQIQRSFFASTTVE